MSNIEVVHHGNFNNLEKFLGVVSGGKYISSILDKYGEKGVAALREATPKRTGLTANSWYYEKVVENSTIKLVFKNSNIKDGYANVAILLQYGHGTNNGGYVKGIDYINPALKTVFTDLADDAWKEVENA